RRFAFAGLCSLTRACEVMSDELTEIGEAGRRGAVSYRTAARCHCGAQGGDCLAIAAVIWLSFAEQVAIDSGIGAEFLGENRNLSIRSSGHLFAQELAQRIE